MKKAFLLLIIISVFFVFGCTENNVETPLENTPTFEDLQEANPYVTERCENFETQDSKDICYQLEAVDKLNENYCQLVVNNQIKDSCYNTLASGKDKPELCEKITIEDNKDDCYGSMALLFKDESFCDKVKSSQIKSECVVEFFFLTGDMNYLSHVSSEDKDDYLSTKATYDSNIIFCNEIQNKEKRNECYDLVSQIDDFGLLYYYLEEDGYYIKLPVSWGWVDSFEDFVTFQMIRKSGEESSDHIVATKTNFSEKGFEGITLNEYYNSYVTGIGKLDFTITSSENATISGIPAKKFQVEGVINKIYTKKTIYITILDNYGYEFVLSEFKNDFDSEELFEEIIKSIEFV